MNTTSSASSWIAATRFTVDDETPHIEVHQHIARSTGTGRLLVRICPAGVYDEAADGTITVDAAGCLECGACLAVAPAGTLTWHYPRGGMGVHYREG